MKHLFLDLERPLNRKEWWLAQAILLAVSNVVYFLLAWDMIAQGHDLLQIVNSPQIQTAMWITMLIGLLPAIKRYRALGRSGWRSLLVFVPLVGPVWQMIECGILPDRVMAVNRREEAPGLAG